jgi:hypothetical protein
MINGAAQVLTERYPGVPIASVHDALFATAPHVNLVRGVILEQFAMLGSSPHINII